MGVFGAHHEADRCLDNIQLDGRSDRKLWQEQIQIVREFGQFQQEFPRDRAMSMAREVEASPFHLQPNGVAERIAEALRNRSGFSLIRLGDGEGAFITLGNVDEVRFKGLYAFNRRDRARVWFLDKVDANEDPWLSEAKKITHIIADADVIGMPYLNWVEHEYRILSITGIVALTNVLRARRSPKAATCTQLIHMDLHNSKLLYELIRSQKRIGLISCQRELPTRLRDALGLEDVDYYHVPGEQGHSHLLTPSAVEGNHWPNRYLEIMQVIGSKRLEGKLFLVAAGLLGKLYCDRIKKSGGVAVDVGSLADGWVGSNTRPGMPQLKIG
jgi:hypothetical protein